MWGYCTATRIVGIENLDARRDKYLHLFGEGHEIRSHKYTAEANDAVNKFNRHGFLRH